MTGSHRSHHKAEPIAANAAYPNAKRENAFGLLMSLNMLFETGDGFDYTAEQFRD